MSMQRRARGGGLIDTFASPCVSPRHKNYPYSLSSPAWFETQFRKCVTVPELWLFSKPLSKPETATTVNHICVDVPIAVASASCRTNCHHPPDLKVIRFPSRHSGFNWSVRFEMNIKPEEATAVYQGKSVFCVGESPTRCSVRAGHHMATGWGAPCISVALLCFVVHDARVERFHQILVVHRAGVDDSFHNFGCATGLSTLFFGDAQFFHQLVQCGAADSEFSRRWSDLP